MTKFKVVANWKMNGSHEKISLFLKQLQEQSHSNKDIIFCPPYPYLSFSKELLSLENISLGAQNCHHKSSGAYTGNVCVDMLKDCGCSTVIIGHSEVRQYLGDTDETILEKVRLNEDAGLSSILCVGETLEDRNNGNYLQFIQSQLSAIAKQSFDWGRICIAYEPIWSIGTGVVPTIQQIEEVHTFIKSLISSSNMAVLYGGSVNESNIKEIAALPCVDGVLVGGASLKIETFSQLLSQIP